MFFRKQILIKYKRKIKLAKQKNGEEKNNKEQDIRKKKCKNKKYSVVYDLISNNPISLNEIYLKLKININEINNILLLLEIEGYIEKVAGGYICTTNN